MGRWVDQSMLHVYMHENPHNKSHFFAQLATFVLVFFYKSLQSFIKKLMYIGKIGLLLMNHSVRMADPLTGNVFDGMEWRCVYVIHETKVPSPYPPQYLPVVSTSSSSLEIWMIVKLPRLTLGQCKETDDRCVERWLLYWRRV